MFFPMKLLTDASQNRKRNCSFLHALSLGASEDVLPACLSTGAERFEHHHIKRLQRGGAVG